MSTRLLRWMTRSWILVFGLFIAFIVAGLAIETLAGMGLTARNTTLWAVLHPGWVAYLAGLVLLVTADKLSRTARRALQRRESSPMAANENGSIHPMP